MNDTTEFALFDMAPTPLPEPPPKMSPDRRRTQRQAAAIASGGHPLALVHGPLAFPRHPDTKGLDYEPGPQADPFTCGSCRFRQVLAWHNRAYPKCVKHPPGMDADRYERSVPLWASHGASTDVRRWWPACADYEPGDPGLSPDAWRSIPTEDGAG
jgi:hypothetical protein